MPPHSTQHTIGDALLWFNWPEETLEKAVPRSPNDHSSFADLPLTRYLDVQRRALAITHRGMSNIF
jgi:hypothetical protein